MSETKLGDRMVRDPFHKSVEVKAKGGLRLAFERLGIREPAIPLVVTPANRKKHVIDAKADGTCDFCKQAVWMSPSSWRSTWTTIVCLECLEKAVGMEAFDP